MPGSRGDPFYGKGGGGGETGQENPGAGTWHGFLRKPHDCHVIPQARWEPGGPCRILSLPPASSSL